MTDFGKVIYRQANGAYVIESGTFCVPNPSDESVPEDIRKNFSEKWNEIDSYAKAHPDMVTVEKPYEPTSEEIAAQELAKAKDERSKAVSNITVEVDGMTFDGDETSQQRMARSIVALEDGETMPWVLYDNTIAQVTKEQLKQALRLAGIKQSELWVLPYVKEDPLAEE